MIKLQDYTPSIYYEQSRDFQFIGRLYDIVLNSIKTNAMLINELPFGNNSDTQLLDLLSTTLGFKAKHKYNIKQLTAICSVLTKILKNKGTENAIAIAVNALMRAEDYDLRKNDPKAKIEIIINDDVPNIIYIIIPMKLSDMNLFNDLMEYILPAGMIFRIINSNNFVYRTKEDAAETTIIFEDDSTIDNYIADNSEMPNSVVKLSDSIDYADPYLIDKAKKYKPGYINNTVVVNVKKPE